MSSLFLKIHTLILLVFILGLSISSGPVAAQNSGLAGITMSERAGFAFYALTRKRPAFEDWIRYTEAYHNAQPNIRIEMMDYERQRLERGFASYLPTRDFITLHFAVRVKIIEDGELAQIQAQKKSDTLYSAMNISIPGMTRMVYFPFQIGRDWVAIVPQMIEPSNIHLVPTDHMREIASALGINAKEEKMIEAELILRPSRADGEQQMLIDGQPMFIMLADIASFALLDKDRKAVWDQTAPWHYSTRRKDLINLHGGGY